MFEELATYMSSLEKLLKLRPQKLYPGHGPIVEDGEAVIRQYITHRNARENQVSGEEEGGEKREERRRGRL